MIFAVEKLEQCWNEIMVLANQHWLETQNYRHHQPFGPSFERYKQQEDWGSYVQFTARVDGKLVGYGGIYIVPSMHTQTMICTEDTWYLAPEYRKGLTAVRFMKFMEKTAAERGAQDVTLTTPVTSKVDRIHEYLGYKQVAKVLYKRISAPDSSGL